MKYIYCKLFVNKKYILLKFNLQPCTINGDLLRHRGENTLSK